MQQSHGNTQSYTYEVSLISLVQLATTLSMGSTRDQEILNKKIVNPGHKSTANTKQQETYLGSAATPIRLENRIVRCFEGRGSLKETR